MSAPSPEPGPESVPRHLEIRKYPNRRYYDATRSRHLTLEDIRRLIREGHDLTVTDSKSGADITAQVLTQIILELETPKIDSFPVPLLLRVIRANDQLVREFMDTYFTQAFGAFMAYQKQLEDRLRHVRAMTGVLPPFPAWTSAMFGGFAPEPPASPATPPPPWMPGSPPPSPPADDLHRRVADLQRQVDSLGQQLRRARGRKRDGR